VIATDGARRPVPSYTAWWLRRHVRIEGNPLDRLCRADAEAVVRALLTPVVLDVDTSFAHAIGMVHRLADARADVLLDLLVDPSSAITAGALAEVYADLAGRDPESVRPPARLRIPDGVHSRVVDAAEVVLADAPFWLQLDLPAVLPGPTGLADVLDIDLVSDVVDARPESSGRVLTVPDVVGSILPEAPTTYVEHDDLVVAGRPVAWWVESGVVHAATSDGLARGLAWVAGRWSARWLVAAVLVDPASATTLATDELFN
jgi:hypothetical protein